MEWLRFCLVRTWICYSLVFTAIAEEQLELGDPAECKNADFVPGYNLGGEGFDIVKMERKGSYVIDMEKWDIGNGSCQMRNNVYLKNIKQKTPVAMTFWRTLPKCSRKVASKIYESSEALVNDSTSSILNNWKFGLDIALIFGVAIGGTHSREAKYGMTKSKEDKFSFIKHVVDCSFYSYQIQKHSPPLHREFLQAVKSLPPEYESHSYEGIINTFGTHYTTGVNLGGKLKAVTAIRTCKATMNGLTDTAVKDCLGLEASNQIIVTTPEYKYCQTLKKKMGTNENFNVIFDDRLTEIVGGNINGKDLLFSGSSKSKALKKWLESLKTIPDVVTYSLQPLHLLLSDNERAKKGLKRAIEKYIRDNALKKLCSESCKMGRQISVRDPCICVCEQNENILSNCCPAEKGLAKLKVFNLRANGLYGDQVTQTDSFVKVEYGNVIRRSEVIKNDDNPSWRESFEFGPVKISVTKKITFKVYDDDVWNDDLLGECSFDLRSGNVDDVCTFKYGTFFFSYSVICAPSLQGPRCADYSPSPADTTLADIFHSRNGILAKDEWKLQVTPNSSSKVH